MNVDGHVEGRGAYMTTAIHAGACSLRVSGSRKTTASRIVSFAIVFFSRARATD